MGGAALSSCFGFSARGTQVQAAYSRVEVEARSGVGVAERHDARRCDSTLACEVQRAMGGWRDKAACRDMDPDLFFPATRQEERLALKACSTCSSIRECARYAAEHARINGYPLQGVWGWINRSKGKNKIGWQERATMSITNNQRELILKWHRGKASSPEYTAKLLSVPLDEVLYIIAHPETPAPHKDDSTPEFIEPLL